MSKKREEIEDIDKIVDKIILKHKDKLERVYSEEIDVESFSLKNKEGDTLYYLKKKSDKKTKETDKSKILSEKITTEARENLGEDPLEIDEITEEIDGAAGDANKKKKRIRFGRIDKKTDDVSLPPTTEDMIESKEFDDVISEIDDFLKDEKPKETDEDEKIVDKKIIEEPAVDDSTEKKGELEAKAAELVEQHDLFSDKKPDETEDNKEDDWISSFTDDLAGFKKKYPGKVTFSDLDLEELDKSEENESDLLDQKIKEDSLTEESDKKEYKKAEEGIGASKPKKSFFKKDKPPQETPSEPKEKEVKPDEPMIQPIFRVENLPKSDEFSEDEKGILDEKLKESSEPVDTAEAENKAEAKAAMLAQEHLKDKDTPASKDESTEIKKSKPEIEVPDLVPLAEADSEHEHVFFDEEESSSGGWSPQISDAEKKKMISDTTAEGEISFDDLARVGDIELPKEVLKTKSVKLSDLGFSEKEWEELDFYSLYEPFSYVEILREKESLDKCYFLVEMALSEEEEKILGFIEDTMACQDIDTVEFDEKDKDEYLLEQLNEVIKEYNVEINEQSKNKIFYYMAKKALGLGKIDPLMKDPNIEDISCDGAGIPLFLYHRKYGSLKSNIRFNTEDELSSFVFKLAQKCGKHISIAEPMLDATLPDGSRIQMTLSDEVTTKGSTFTIRKFGDNPFSPPDLVEFNTMSSEMTAYMWLAVENGINTLFAGGTASGKTTTLNALSLFIPRESKIVSIEETREINLPHPNWIPGVSRSGFGEVVADKVVGEIDMYDLMKAALRQRPEYIIVGEIRGKEAYVLFQAMATGHATYSTVHADSAQSLIHRLEGKPINIPRIMLQSLDIVCIHVITRVKNIRARRCKQIIEIIDIDPTTKEILTNEVFRWDPVEDKFIYSGKSYVLERIRAEKDLTREEMTAEIRNRMKIVEWMNENNIRAFRDVAKMVAQYTEAPGEMLSKLKDVKIDA